MTTKKDFYNTLGLKNTASRADIDAAYQFLASKHHPDKNPTDRLGAQKRFNEVTEAYINLSNPARRYQYDVLTGSQYSIDDAFKVFDRFFQDKGIFGEEEKLFFDKHYPQKKKSYYEILGVRRGAPLDDIKKSYKKLALKYHPRANPGDKEAEKHFLEISDAFNHLSDPIRRNIYDVSLSGEIKPSIAHNIYEGYNSLIEREKRELDNLKPETEYAESFSESTYTHKTPQGLVGKKVSHKSSLDNGNKVSVSTEEVIRPDGSRDITETVNEGGRVTTNKYSLAKGEERKQVGHGGQGEIKN